MGKMRFNRYDYAAFLSFATYAMCSVVIPMTLVALARELSFPLQEGGMGQGGFLQLGRSIPMVAAILACGVLSGIWGKRVALALALTCMGAGIVIAGFAPVYGVVLLAVAVAGLGEGVIEGLATPFVQDLHTDQPGRYINFTHSFWSVGVVAAVLGTGGLLALGVSWRWIAVGVGLMALVPAVMMIWPDRKKCYHETNERFHWREVWTKTKTILKCARFWLFFAAMFFAGGGEYCLTFWVPSFIEIEHGGTPMNAGIATALFATGMVGGRMGSGWWVKQEGLKRLILVTGAVATGLGLFFPWVTALWMLYPLLFLIGLACAPFWPSIQSDATERLGLDSTMLLVLLSCAGVPGCGVFTWLMGWLGDRVGLRESFYLVPACFLLMTLFVAWGASVPGKARDLLRKS